MWYSRYACQFDGTTGLRRLGGSGGPLAWQVAGCRQMSIDLDLIAGRLAGLPLASTWWGAAVDAAFTAVTDLAEHIRQTATAVDAVGAGWPRAAGGTPRRR